MLDIVREYLALEDKPVQLVKNYEEVLQKHIVFPCAVQIKYDGVYALIVVSNDEIGIFGRTGRELFKSTHEALRNYEHADWIDGVYITEITCSALSLEELSGLVNPNRKKDWTQEEMEKYLEGSALHIHDYLTVQELLEGHSTLPYLKRYERLVINLGRMQRTSQLVANQMVYYPNEIEDLAKFHIGAGHEGIVIKQLAADWVAGHKGYRATKIVRGVSLDLRCVGVGYGKGKRAGLIGWLEFEYKGSTFKADLGAGWTDLRRKNLTLAHEESVQGYTTTVTDTSTGEVFPSPIGKIWQVDALQVSSTGKALRLPKAVMIRHDKDESDG